MGITRVAADRSKPGVDEGSGLVLSSGYFEVTWVGKLYSTGFGEGDPIGNSEGTRVVNKKDEVMGTTFGVSYRRKHGVEEGA